MREIVIDEDTRVIYDYEKHHYIIENQNTTTPREAVKDTLDVLNIIAPNHGITENDLISLATDIEVLKELYYTWEDTGAYIKTIQLNDYAQYPLTVETEKSKLYIMNSPVIIDLRLNEERRVRLLQIQAFYRDTLGLLVSLPDLNTLYELLISYYNPTCYNEITIIEDETNADNYSLKYTDTLYLSDYRGTSQATYSCILNPNHEYSYNTIASISNIESNAITLTTTVPTIIQEGTVINLANTSVQLDTATYSSDGFYTVLSTETDTIYTTENLPYNFYVELPTLNIVAYKNTITGIDRDKQTITLTNFATDLLIGDTIVVKGAVQYTQYETLSDDGFYTIVGIEDNILHVSEVPNTNFNTTGTSAYVYKPIPILTVTGINNNVITVAENSFPSTLTNNTPIAVFTTPQREIDTTYIQYGTVTELNSNTREITVDTALEDNVPKYGILREPTPKPYVLINVDMSKKEKVLPEGSFIVDSTEQAISYLHLLNSIVVPSDEDADIDNGIGNFNSCNKVVKNYYIINSVNGIHRMISKGVYSKVYSNENANYNIS